MKIVWIVPSLIRLIPHPSPRIPPPRPPCRPRPPIRVRRHGVPRPRPRCPWRGAGSAWAPRRRSSPTQLQLASRSRTLTLTSCLTLFRASGWIPRRRLTLVARWVTLLSVLELNRADIRGVTVPAGLSETTQGGMIPRNF